MVEDDLVRTDWAQRVGDRVHVGVVDEFLGLRCRDGDLEGLAGAPIAHRSRQLAQLEGDRLARGGKRSLELRVRGAEREGRRGNEGGQERALLVEDADDAT